MPSAAAARVCTPPAFSRASTISAFSKASTRSVNVASAPFASGFRPARCSGQVRGRDHVAAGQHHRAVDEVLELAHVAGVVVLQEEVHRLAGDAAGLALVGEAPQEVVDQERDVLAPLAQRRQRDRDDVQAEEEILAEVAGPDHGLEVAVGGGDEAHVHLDRACVPPRRSKALLLQDAQQLHLRAARQVADLVEEEGAAVGQLEAAPVLAVRPGEGAPLVAEQLRLEERLRQRGHVHRHERARAGAGSRSGWPGRAAPCPSRSRRGSGWSPGSPPRGRPC